MIKPGAFAYQEQTAYTERLEQELAREKENTANHAAYWTEEFEKMERKLAEAVRLVEHWKEEARRNDKNTTYWRKRTESAERELSVSRSGNLQ